MLKIIRRVSIFLLIGLSILSLSGKDNNEKHEGTVYKFNLKTDINPSAVRITQKALREAREHNADVLILEMNTYGGLLVDADSIRSMLLDDTIYTIVFINPNAASAGALIAISCDKIYMSGGATIGAATVVNQSGDVMPDKYQSYMRALMRSTAEEKGRDPLIAAAMVDQNIEIEGITPKGEVLTFTTSEALIHGFCDDKAESIKDIIKAEGLENYKLIVQELDVVDKIINFLIHPAISGLLILLIIGGIYFELQTPGFGFPILLSLIAAVLYFAPLYLEQLTGAWEITIFIIGIILLGIEVFVIPGFGVAGIIGFILIFSGLMFSLVRNDAFDFSMVGYRAFFEAFITVLASFILSVVLMFFTGRQLINSKFFNRLVLSATLSTKKAYKESGQNSIDMTGMTGKTITKLYPSGKVEISHEVFDAISEGSFIDKGVEVKVVKDLITKLVVRTRDEEN